MNKLILSDGDDLNDYESTFTIEESRGKKRFFYLRTNKSEGKSTGSVRIRRILNP